MNSPGNPVNLKKIVGSKWTAVLPENREKHFIVLDWERDENDQPTDRIQLEAILTGTVRLLHHKALAEQEEWLIGWR